MSYHVSFEVLAAIKAGAVAIKTPVFGALDGDHPDEYEGDEISSWRLGDVFCAGNANIIFVQGEFAKRGLGYVEKTTRRDLALWQAHAREAGKPGFADFLAKLRPEKVNASW